MKVALLGDRRSTPEIGHLGSAIYKRLIDKNVDTTIIHNINKLSDKFSHIVHCRKIEDSLQGAINHAQETGTPMIHLSTGMMEKVQLPEDLNFTFIEAPNASPDVVQFMNEIEDSANQYEGWIKTIIEHHQPEKDSCPGTAETMAQPLGIDPKKRIIVQDWENFKSKNTLNLHGGLISVRDWPGSQQEWQIPDEYRSGYAAHKILLHNPESGFTKALSEHINGREAYASGTYQLLESLDQRDDIPKGLIHVTEYVRQGLHLI